MIYLITAAVLIFGGAAAQNSDCDFMQDIKIHTTYYIYSPNYPQNYKPGVKCRWIGNCPEGYNCRLDCRLLMPLSTGCSADYIAISKSGDPTLTGAEVYCGTGSLSVVSTGRSISLGLSVPSSSQGGNFICDLNAQPEPDTPASTQ